MKDGCRVRISCDKLADISSKYEFRRVLDHIEVFLNNEFQFSADSMVEALAELNDRT